MADNVIGDAVIEVGADGAKFRGDLEGLGKDAPGLGERISGAVGKTLKAGLVVVGAAAGAALAKTLFGGFNRLANIDQATKKLEGLGHTGEALQTIMDNALASVKNTAFGLDEAATVAANLVAAGIKPGSDLEEGLRLVANTASVAGTSMAEIGDIFTEVAAGGKVTGDTLARLQARGIPALQLLADQLGLTREATAKMVSSGQVDFETFAGAINESMGSAAIIAGESFRGMLANIGAAMNRLGAVALTPAFEGVKTIMPKVIDLFDRAATALAPLVDKIAPQVAAFFDWLGGVIDGISFDGIGTGLGNLSAIFETVSTTAYDILGRLFSALPGIMTELLPTVADAIASKIHILLTTLTVVVNALAEAFAKALPELVDRFAALLPMMVEEVKTLAPQVVGAFLRLLTALVDLVPIVAPAVLEALTTLIMGAVALLPSLIPALIEGALSLFTALVQAVLLVLPVLITTLLNVLPLIVETLVSMLPALLTAAVTLFTMLVQGIVDVLPVLLETLLGILPDLITSILGMLPDILAAAVELFMALVQGVVDILPLLIETILGMLPDIIVAVLDMLPALIEAAFDLFYALIFGLLDMLPKLLMTLIGLAPKIVMAIMSMLPELIEAAFDLFLGITAGLIKYTPELLKALWELGPQMVSAIGDLIDDLRQAGKDLLQGLINGFGDMAGRVKDKIVSVAEGALNAVKGFFGINSPSKVFAEIGVGLGEGLIKGVDKMSNPIEKAVADMVSGVPEVATVNIRRNLVPVSGVPTTFPGRSDAAYQTEQMIAAQKASGARTYGDVNVAITVPLEDLAQLKDLEAFLEMVRVRSRMGSDGSDN